MKKTHYICYHIHKYKGALDMRINNYVYPNKLVNLEGIDKWLGTENHEEIGNMNRLITNKDIKSVTISLPTNKIPGRDGIPL